MSQFNDARYTALVNQGYSGTVNDMLFAWLGDNGGSGTLSDRWLGMVRSQLSASDGQFNDLWYELLGNLGYAGTLQDRELAFWAAGGNLGAPTTFYITREDGSDLLREDSTQYEREG